jgi:UDP-N-acetylmuramoyl-L-alanyl-D-glutamate--2,6-diaminopimelate ligase
MLLNLDGSEIWTRFVGKFNASNLLAVYATAIRLGQNKDEILTIISNLHPVQGRFETVRSLDGNWQLSITRTRPMHSKMCWVQFQKSEQETNR